MTEDILLPFDTDTTWVHGDKPYVHWVLRVERRRNIYDRLKQIGTLSLLGLTSILTGWDGITVEPLTEDSNADVVFKKSYMYKNNTKRTNRSVWRLPTEDYQRAEEAFQSFAMTTCLAVSEQEDKLLLTNFNELKKWVYRMMNSTVSVDMVCRYFKWLIKACQMIFLGREVPDPEPWFPNLSGTFHPFQGGKLEFLNEFFRARRATRRLTLDEAEILAQLCNGVRSLPYPSKLQMQESIDDTLKVLRNRKTLSTEQIARYRAGLAQIKLRLGVYKENKSHISLTTSACVEKPQSQGGKAAYFVEEIKKHFCVPATSELEAIEGLQDHLGFIPLQRGITAFIREGIMIHDLLYLPTDRAEEYLRSIDVTCDRVPYDYGKTTILIASMKLKEEGLGSYIGEIPNKWNIPLFKGKTKFVPSVSYIKTKASLVQEKGLKTRLITTTSAAKALVEQLFGHMVRAYLSQDPFHRVGFEEPDKLWETLKSYAKSKNIPRPEV